MAVQPHRNQEHVPFSTLFGLAHLSLKWLGCGALPSSRSRSVKYLALVFLSFSGNLLHVRNIGVTQALELHGFSSLGHIH